jgi:hypothetical protein
MKLEKIAISLETGVFRNEHYITIIHPKVGMLFEGFEADGGAVPRFNARRWRISILLRLIH